MMISICGRGLDAAVGAIGEPGMTDAQPHPGAQREHGSALMYGRTVKPS